MQEREFSMIIIASHPDMFRSCFLKVFELQRVETFQTTHKTHFTDICIHILIFTYQNTQFLKNKSLSSTTFMLRLWFDRFTKCIHPNKHYLCVVYNAYALSHCLLCLLSKVLQVSIFVFSLFNSTSVLNSSLVSQWICPVRESQLLICFTVGIYVWVRL